MLTCFQRDHNMHKFLVRIMCCFIPSRKKRHEVWHDFKVKHGYIAPDYIKNLENTVAELAGIVKAQENNFCNLANIGTKLDILEQKIYQEKQNLRNSQFYDNARLIATAELHKKTFAGYRNKFAGKTIVLVGAGPSLNQFKPIKNAIYVGLNRAFLFDKVKFDYLFSIDKAGIDKIYDKFIKYDCIKFVGDQNLGKNWQIPESIINKIPNVLRYKTDVGFPCKFALDIEFEPLANFNTVSLQAMQFILYTNPAKVYLVGIDCSTAGHFTDNTKHHIEDFDLKGRGDNVSVMMNNSIEYWKQLKEFADTYYPETEIISVNPVGLRGLFKDLDQKD